MKKIDFLSGTALSLRINLMKIGKKLPEDLLNYLIENSDTHESIMKIGDSFIIEGYCQGTLLNTAPTYVVVVKNKQDNYIRGTRAHDSFKALKVVNELA